MSEVIWLEQEKEWKWENASCLWATRTDLAAKVLCVLGSVRWKKESVCGVSVPAKRRSAARPIWCAATKYTRL